MGFSPAGAGKKLMSVSSQVWQEDEADAVIDEKGAELPLDDLQLFFATELQLGDHPGTGHALLRTAAGGTGAPLARQPPPDISTLGDMRLVKQRARARQAGARFVLDRGARKQEELRHWADLGIKARAEPEPDDDHYSGALHFDEVWKAKTLKLSPDLRCASWHDRQYGGMVLSVEAVRKQVIGRYFEVQIEESDARRWQDGLGIGVAVKPKKEAISHLRNIQGQFEGYACELLPSSWLLGYDGGRAKLCGHNRYLTAGEMPKGLWRPRELRSGDVVALLITPDGHMMLFVNDELRVMAQFCEGLDKHWLVTLHVAIDLDGCTKTVRLLDTNGSPSKKVQLEHAKFREAAYKATCASDAGMQLDAER